MPNHSSSAKLQQATEFDPTRRRFLAAASATLAGLALTESQALAQATCPATGGIPAAGGALPEVGEIRAANHVLSAIVRVDDEAKGFWTSATACSEAQQMRYFAGVGANGKQVWPAKAGLPAPGPTLRARVGDQVQITLLNHVNVKNFPRTLDQAEQGKGKGGCDVSTTLKPDASGNMQQVEVYPGTGPDADHAPDCFHGSSSANLHFHGFHVSPGTIADNVLVQVAPSPRDAAGRPVVTEAAVRLAFQQVFHRAEQGHGPQKWGDLPVSYTSMEQALLRQYDSTLPPGLGKLWPANEKAIAQGLWPQFYMGAYPYSFKITEPAKPIGPGMPDALMGQCPGTHWYHAHKHGSTALNSFNGMSGVFIVEGDFDDKLRAYYGAGQLEEKVLVLQQIASTLNLMGNGGGPPQIVVNGVPQPVLTMKPGETQRWRILNACAQKAAAIAITSVASSGSPPTWRQIAQDGVQFAFANYTAANPTPTLAPGNRVDLLVQAPATAGIFTVQANGATLFTVNVAGAGVTPKPFPDQADYPAMPGFLADLDPSEIHVRRDITFDTKPQTGRAGFGPRHSINGKQFSNFDIDQIMKLNSVEEWTLFNAASGVAHPFHIHVNPFQVVEIFDPIKSPQPTKCTPPFVWWDVFAIPAGGYVKIRSRFADFIGFYVLHCHILAHEDRGMMQLVEVVSDKTTAEHAH